MGEISFQQQGNQFMLTFDKVWLEQNSIELLTKFLRLQLLTEKATFDEKALNELADDMNRPWFQQHGEAFLKGSIN